MSARGEHCPLKHLSARRAKSRDLQDQSVSSTELSRQATFTDATEPSSPNPKKRRRLNILLAVLFATLLLILLGCTDDGKTLDDLFQERCDNEQTAVFGELKALEQYAENFRDYVAGNAADGLEVMRRARAMRNDAESLYWDAENYLLGCFDEDGRNNAAQKLERMMDEIRHWTIDLCSHAVIAHYAAEYSKYNPQSSHVPDIDDIDFEIEFQCRTKEVDMKWPYG